MEWVPSPAKYDREIKWDKIFPSKGYGKFLKKARYLLSHDIENEAKKKVQKYNGKNPGPSNYDNDKKWTYQS